MRTPPAGSRRLLWGLVAVLAIWGVYLAIGATGIFTDVGMFDARRSAIVLACSATFLGCWIAILARRPSPNPSTAAPLNWPSVASLLSIGAAFALWAGAWVAWRSGNPANLTFVLGWLAVGLFGVAAILALIGLSDQRRERGKLWGLLTLALLLAAGVGLIVQVRHYSESRAHLDSALIRPAGTFSRGEKEVATAPCTRNQTGERHTPSDVNPTT